MANNQYNFLDYAGLSLFWNNVKSIIEENELATASALTNLDTRVDNLEASKSDKGHQHEKITHTLWSYYDAIPDTTSPADICARFDVSITKVNAVFTGMVQAPDGTRNQSLFWTDYGAAGLVELTKSYGGDTRLKYRVSTGWEDVGANWSTAGYRELANVEDLTWANIKSKPETATRWPSWSEITSKPTTISGYGITDALTTSNYTSYTVKKDGTGASGTWGINISGNSATATKIGTSTIGSTTMPVYIKSGAPTAITSFPEAYLSWGGTNTAGSVTPIGMTLSSEHSANRLAFINGNALKFEYSSNAGSTWTDYGYTASIKSQVFTTLYDVPIGRTNSSTEYTTNSRTRITLTAQDGTNSYVYTNPRKMLINISSSGGMQVLIEYRTGTNYKNNGAWTTFGTYTLSGWSGWNDIPLILNTLGGGSTQTANNWQLRLTFIMTSKYADYPTSASVNCIRIFGENAWTSPSTMATTGHLYSFDVGQNATFPAAVTSTKFVKSGGTSAQFLKADGSVDSNTYSKSGHTHKGSEVTLTGYSKASSYSEISASDTVNQAIAKLEGALSGLEALLASI